MSHFASLSKLAAAFLLVCILAHTGCSERPLPGEGRFLNNATPGPYPSAWPTPVNTSTPYPTTGPNPTATPEPTNGWVPTLEIREGALFGNALILGDKADRGDGILFGVGAFQFLANREYSEQKIEDSICMLGDIGFNLFRTFAANVPESGDGDFVSPFENKDEWIRRRNRMLDAGLKCKVYIKLTLFERKSESWNDEDPSLTTAKQLAEQYYLAGIDPASSRGKVLIVDHAYTPKDSFWSVETSNGFHSWLKQKGFKSGGAGELRDNEYWGGDMIEVHQDGDYRPGEFTDESVSTIYEGKKKAPYIATDGVSASDNSEASINMLFRTIWESVNDSISFEITLKEPFSLLEPDKEVSHNTDSQNWSGSTRDLLKQCRKAGDEKMGY